jgi:ammonium transporter, Amt family
MYLGPAKKPTFLGAVNGMVVGLVAITPCAGYVNGAGAMLIGAIDSTIVWMAWTYLSRASFMRRVDDAMGIVYTHGIAGFFGGILLGVFADPSVVEYRYVRGYKGPVAITGALYGHPKQVLIQFLAAVTIILWDATITFLILTVIKWVMPSHKLKMDDDILEIGDLAVHDEEGYPEPEGATRILPGYGEAMPVPAAPAPPRPAVAGTGGGGS